MIHLMEETIAEIPLLHVVQAEFHDQALPTVLYYHGYNGEKISSLTLAYKIAEKGYRVILPDCLYHGARKKEMNRAEKDRSFWDIVIQSLNEMSTLKEQLVDKGYSKKNRFGIGGTSMGGILTYSALVRYDWIKVAAVLMGTPYTSGYAKRLVDDFNTTNDWKVTEEEKRIVLEQLAINDISLHPHALQERPLLIWHGEEDAVVPYQHSVSFYESILEYYKDKEKIRFVSEPERSHHISNLAMNETADWFGSYL